MKKLSCIILVSLLINVVFAATYSEAVPEVTEISNLDILGAWEFDSYASQKAASNEEAKKLIMKFDKLRFYFQKDGSVEMAGGEVAYYTQVSSNKFSIKVDDTILIFTLIEDMLYAEIPLSENRIIYPVFSKDKNN